MLPRANFSQRTSRRMPLPERSGALRWASVQSTLALFRIRAISDYSIEEPTANMDMEKLVSLCKRRGFLFQSSEIYGGLNGFWDYGPLGVELKRNVKESWWRDMVTGHDDLATLPGAPCPYEMVGLDCAIIMHPQVWKCSGHYDLFHDFMVDCRESKRRYRHDQVRGRWVEAKGRTAFIATQSGGDEGLAETEQRALKLFNLRAKNLEELIWKGPLVSLTT